MECVTYSRERRGWREGKQRWDKSGIGYAALGPSRDLGSQAKVRVAPHGSRCFFRHQSQQLSSSDALRRRLDFFPLQNSVLTAATVHGTRSIFSLWPHDRLICSYSTYTTRRRYEEKKYMLCIYNICLYINSISSRQWQKPYHTILRLPFSLWPRSKAR